MKGRDGGARRNRTADLLHAMQALSQLSYDPVSGPSVTQARHGTLPLLQRGHPEVAVAGLAIVGLRPLIKQNFRVPDGRESLTILLRLPCRRPR